MHKIIAVLAALSTIILTLATTPSTAQASSKRHKVSIAVSSRTITLYSNITITGKVSPAVGTVVKVQRKWSGKKWITIATVPMATDGSYSYTYQVRSTPTRQYRTYSPKAGKVKAAYSKVIKVTVRVAPKASSSVTITGTGPTSITAGENFVVNGVTSANLAGKGVQLQLQDGTGWSTIGSATVAANATFSVSGPALQAGASKVVRVYAPATGSTYESASGGAGFVVYGWYYLSEMDTVEGDLAKGSATISGQYFPKSTWFDYLSYYPTQSAQYDLGRKCTTFAATVGWNDSSSSTSVGDASVYKDTVSAWSKTGIAFGSATPMSIDITGALRLKLEARRSNATRNNDSMTYGDARIRCAF
jgi:hypothetical protein